MQRQPVSLDRLSLFRGLQRIVILAILATVAVPPLHASGNWTSIGPAAASIRSLVAANGVLYAATPDGVERSQDGGHRWRAVNVGLDPAAWPSVLVADTEHSGLLYAGGSELFRSFDGAASWQALHFPCGDVLEIVIAPSRPRTLYIVALQSGRPSTMNLAKSVDRGQTWTCTPLEFAEGAALAVDPGDSDTLYAGAEGIFKSTESGAVGSWVRIHRSLPPLEFLGAVAVDPSVAETIRKSSGAD